MEKTEYQKKRKDRAAKKEVKHTNRSHKNSREIAYQNKDIASKMLAESLKGKTSDLYGQTD